MPVSVHRRAGLYRQLRVQRIDITALSACLPAVDRSIPVHGLQGLGRVQNGLAGLGRSQAELGSGRR